MKTKLNNLKVGAAIKQLRTGLGMSQVELSNAINATQTHISQIENGAARASIKMINKISKKFNVKPKQIISLASGTKSDAEIINIIFEYFN